METDDEDTNPVRAAPETSPFDIGDRTILQMRSQKFDVEEFGTIVGPPRLGDTLVTRAREVSAEPLERIEQKLDAALRALETLQLRVDSLDSLLSRVVNR